MTGRYQECISFNHLAKDMIRWRNRVIKYMTTLSPCFYTNVDTISGCDVITQSFLGNIPTDSEVNQNGLIIALLHNSDCISAAMFTSLYMHRHQHKFLLKVNINKYNSSFCKVMFHGSYWFLKTSQLPMLYLLCSL